MIAELLRMDNVYCQIDGNDILKNINFTMHRGEVHALMGENGAGKSTLIRVLAGLLPITQGNIYYKEAPVSIRTVKDAKRIGIECVYQNASLSPTLSIAENIFLLNGERNPFWLSRKTLHRPAKALMDQVGLQQYHPSDGISSLTPAEHKMIWLARALSTHPQIVILDELTAPMTASESALVLDVIRSYQEVGVTFLYITHKLDEAVAIADRVTILREGYTALTLRRSEFDKQRLVGLMMGDLSASLHKATKQETPDVSALAVEGLETSGGLHQITFQANKGEVIAVSGARKYELLMALYGLCPMQGTLRINGKTVSIKSPSQAVKNKIAFVPPDRMREGLIPDFSIKDNLTLQSLKKFSLWGFINERLEQFFTRAFLNSNSIHESAQKKIRSLSGGNQQKVMLQRILETRPEILLLINPTEGVDIATRAQLHKHLKTLAADGMTILMCTTEIEEVYTCATRLLVLRDGYLYQDLDCSKMKLEDFLRIEGGVFD